MKVSLSWLKEHLDTAVPFEAIVTQLNALGLVVDGIHNPATALNAFVVAEIVEATQHPNADRLRVCRVNTGQEILQVVCGAPNARTGLKGVFAPLGTTIPANGMVLKPTKIRDVESSGMLCSYAELGMEGGHEGIIELPSDAPVGQKYAVYAGLDDPILDIDVTPNRGDCLAVRGLARDLAATGIGTLKVQTLQSIQASFPSPVNVTIDLPADHEKACRHFTGRVIRGVKNRPSPEWLQKKLNAVGLRSISALVDITNLMAYDWARPMHVFDADKIQGDLVIRLARKGEKLKALDDKEYTLDETMTVVANTNGPLSIAGIMGGVDSGCSDDTTNVFLESAYFDRVSTAQTGRKLGIHSDSRARFERGVDPALVALGLERATQLILDLCGGEASEVVVAGSEVIPGINFIFDPALMQQHGGLDVPLEEIEAILAGLGFKTATVDGSSHLRVYAPTWRQDMENPYDIVEEILRIKGYDAIPAVPLPHHVINNGFESVPGSHVRQRREWIARRTLAARGLCEAITWSFMREDYATLFGGGQPELMVDNPISQDLSIMRPSILPNLIAAVGRSLARGQEAPTFFEVGAQFKNATPAGQQAMVTGVRSGRNLPRTWQGNSDKPSVYTVKADVMEVLAACGIDPSVAQLVTNAPAWYHPGRSGALQMGPKKTLAVFGEIHPRILKALDVSGPLFGFEVYLSELPLPKSEGKKAPLALSQYQSVERDLAFILDQDVPAGKALQVIQKVDKTLIKAVNVFDVYEGANLGTGKKSLAFSIRLEPSERTLTDEEISGIMAKVIQAIKQETGGELRS